jgi:CRISPR-associated Csx2 family protein
MTTLITFIGRAEANRGYRLARYRFSDGFKSESKLFAAAAVAWLRQTSNPPERLLVVGTPTSGWDVLMELVERLAPQHVDAALEWAIPVSESLSRGTVSPAQLRDFEQRFSGVLGVRIDLALAANDGDSVFSALDTAISPSEQVVIDITHSFRSMPVHALIALGALRWLKQVELLDIIYGAFDETGADGVSPARSLGATAHLARHTPALAQLALVDDVGQIAGFYAEKHPPLAEQLSATQRLESVMQFDSASAKRGQAVGTLRGLEGTPIASSVSNRLLETLGSLNQGSGSLGLLSRAKRALARRDFMRALGLANEAIALRAVECYSLREQARATAREDEFYRVLTELVRERLDACVALPECPRLGKQPPGKTLRTLRNARNSVMHAGGSIADQNAPDELRNEAKLTSLLEWSFKFYDFIK